MADDGGDRWVTANPGGADDPLGESILDPERPWWRVFEPADTRLVVGRYQRVEREVDAVAAAADGVPVHRRQTGGGAVVLAPGSLVIGLRLRVERPGSAACFGLINGVLVPAVADLAGIAPTTRGHGDLAVAGEDGERKILGASLRRRGDAAYYLGVLLVGDLVPLMERYLRQPSREPGYRGGRDHGSFCTYLGRWGVDIPALRSRIIDYCLGQLRDHALA